MVGVCRPAACAYGPVTSCSADSLHNVLLCVSIDDAVCGEPPPPFWRARVCRNRGRAVRRRMASCVTGFGDVCFYCAGNRPAGRDRRWRCLCGPHCRARAMVPPAEGTGDRTCRGRVRGRGGADQSDCGAVDHDRRIHAISNIRHTWSCFWRRRLPLRPDDAISRNGQDRKPGRCSRYATSCGGRNSRCST